MAGPSIEVQPDRGNLELPSTSRAKYIETSTRVCTEKASCSRYISAHRTYTHGSKVPTELCQYSVVPRLPLDEHCSGGVPREHRKCEEFEAPQRTPLPTPPQLSRCQLPSTKNTSVSIVKSLWPRLEPLTTFGADQLLKADATGTVHKKTRWEGKRG